MELSQNNSYQAGAAHRNVRINLNVIRLTMIETRKLPTRCFQGQWEVLLDCPQLWLQVDSEEDAKGIAYAWLQATMLRRPTNDNELARVLEDSADVLEHYWGRPGLCSRYLRAKARMALGKCSL